jgi:solute carrier family 8 (sodium/calcium exchanger)
MTAIAFVALGTSLPGMKKSIQIKSELWSFFLSDTFASKVAAEHDKYADSSIGNVNGSNAVNVFLGIGLPWAMSAWYHYFNKGGKFVVEKGSLEFSVALFCSFAAVAVIMLMIRRLKVFGGGELGGPRKYRFISSFLFLLLWIAYLVLSGLENYCHINV